MVASMKVLHIVKTAVGANWAYEQVRVLCSLGIEVVVALPSDTEGLAPKYRQAGATVRPRQPRFPRAASLEGTRCLRKFAATRKRSAP